MQKPFYPKTQPAQRKSKPDTVTILPALSVVPFQTTNGVSTQVNLYIMALGDDGLPYQYDIGAKEWREVV